MAAHATAGGAMGQRGTLTVSTAPAPAVPLPMHSPRTLPPSVPQCRPAPNAPPPPRSL